MCSRFTVTSHPDAVRAVFNYHNPADFPPREAIRPTEPIMIVREGPSAKREMALVRWGFIPHWVKDPDDFPLIINARAETLAEKPSFRTAIAHKRCLIPADAANKLVGTIHDRMPAILPPENFDDWLNVRDDRAKDVLGLLTPAPETLLHIDNIEKAPTKDEPQKQGNLF